MVSRSAANLKNLAAGVDAHLYDGQAATGRPIRLQLNLASLSQRASVDTVNPSSQAVLASNSIQDFRVINPRRRARRRRDGELWLELRGAYIHVVNDDARRAFLGWLDQFAGRSAWQGHNNALAIVLAALFQVFVFFGAAGLLGQISRTLFDQSAGQPWGAISEATAWWHNATPCEADAAIAVLNAVSERMAADVSIDWTVVLGGAAMPPVQYIGGGKAMLNATDLHRLGDPEILGAAIFLTLVERRQNTSDSFLSSLFANGLAAQFHQMNVLPSAGTVLYGWSAAAFDRRSETIPLDDETLVAMAAQGLKAYGLIDYLSVLADLEAANTHSRILPRALNDRPPSKQRLAVVRAKLDQATFVPTTGRPSLGWDEYLTLVDGCAQV